MFVRCLLNRVNTLLHSRAARGRRRWATDLPRTVRQDVCGSWVARRASCGAACGRSRSGSWCRMTWGPPEAGTDPGYADGAGRSACECSRNESSCRRRMERPSAPGPCRAYSSLASLQYAIIPHPWLSTKAQLSLGEVDRTACMRQKARRCERCFFTYLRNFRYNV